MMYSIGYFNGLDTKAFNNCFMEWVDSIADFSEGSVVAIDGKTIRRMTSNLNNSIRSHWT